MTIDQLRKVYEKQPFEPFNIYLADGRVLPVPHRDFMFVPPKQDRAFAIADDYGVIETIDLLLVVSFKPIKPVKPGENGRRRRSA